MLTTPNIHRQAHELRLTFEAPTVLGMQTGMQTLNAQRIL